MMEDKDLDAWAAALSLEQARSELTTRKLSTEGILPTLRQRLLKYELDRVDSDPVTPVIRTHPVEFFGLAGAGVTSLGEPRNTGIPRSAKLVSESTRAVGARSRHDETSGVTEGLYNLVRKWNLRFSGDRAGEDVEDFLEEVTIHRSIVPVADRELLRCLPLFLSGTARMWYMPRHSRWKTWGEFEFAFRNRFAAPGYQLTLRGEVERRTQGEGERAADYITRLRALLDRLDPPWPLHQQLELARRNLLPRIRLFIRRSDYHDFDSLEEAAIGAEAEVRTDREYRPPPPPEKTLVPRLAYHPSRKTTRVNAAVVTEPTSRKERRQSGVAVSRGLTSENAGTRAKESDVPGARDSELERDRGGGPRCWNCSETGHIARQCEKPKKLHCYRCGQSGVTTRNCNRCAGNELGGR